MTSHAVTSRDIFSLKGKTALITGGSRGLGLQIAEALGEKGAKIILSSRKQDDLDEAVAHLGKRSVEAIGIPADLSNEKAALELVTRSLEHLKDIDILVNNAGATWGSPAEDHPVEAWDKVMNINIRSLFLISQAVGKFSMIPRKYGRILNIASIAGLRGNGSSKVQTIAYNASKGAVINFTRALAGEWGRHQITVNALAPGIFPTKMTHGILENIGKDKLSARIPLLRVGDNEELKGAALLFSSDAGRYITGQILAVDGGLTAI